MLKNDVEMHTCLVHSSSPRDAYCSMVTAFFDLAFVTQVVFGYTRRNGIESMSDLVWLCQPQPLEFFRIDQ